MLTTKRLAPWTMLSAIIVFISLTGFAHTPPGFDDIDTVLENLNHTGKQLTSLTAKVEQTKVVAFLNAENKSEGRLFYSKPGNYLLEFTKPDKMTLLIVDKTVWHYSPATKQVHIYNFKNKSDLNKYLVGFGSSFDGIKKDFDVVIEEKKKKKKTTYYTLKLIPREETSLANQYQKIMIHVDGELWLPYRIELFEKDDDLTILEFSQFKKNTVLPKEKFEFNIPDGVRVTDHR